MTGSPDVRVLAAGESALLIEFADPGRISGTARRLRAAPPPGMQDLLPAECTILVIAQPGADLAGLGRAVRRAAAAEPPTASPADVAVAPVASPPNRTAGPDIEIPVRYDGPDLAAVASWTGLAPREVVARHTSTLWRCAFIGFAPGFSYLTSDEVNLELPRRARSRPSVPAGSVAMAGRYSAVYPRASPGGWQLIGTTDLAMWDLAARPPATVRPDMLVRFTDVDHR